MLLRELRRKAAPLSVLTLAVFLTTVLPRAARADDSTPPQPPAPAPPASDRGGPESQATPGTGDAPTISGASVEPSTGSATATIPFRLPTARGDAQPSLALTYNSATGVGYGGLGWTLTTPTIERTPVSGPRKYVDGPTNDPTASDQFVFNGEPLVEICPILGGATCAAALSGEIFPSDYIGWRYFRTEIDNGLRFFFAPGGWTWAVQTKSGIVITFGRLPFAGYGDAFETADPLSPSTGAATAPPADPIYRWHIAMQQDPHGNVVLYDWAALHSADPPHGPGLRYLTDVYDTQIVPEPGSDDTLSDRSRFAHHTHLRWEDATIGWVPEDAAMLRETPGWRSLPAFRLAGVDVSSKPFERPGSARVQVRRYRFSYTPDAGGRSQLRRSELEGACDNVEDTNFQLADSHCPTLPATVYSYSQSSPPNFPPALTPADRWIVPKRYVYTHQTPFFVYTWTVPIRLGVVDWDGSSRATPYSVTDTYYEAHSTPPSYQHWYGFGVGPLVTSANWNDKVLLNDVFPGAANALLGNWLAHPLITSLSVDESARTYRIWTIGDGGWRPAASSPAPLPSTYPDRSAYPLRFSVDVDGDGLTDVLFANDNGFAGPWAVETYFSTRNATGDVKPFGRLVSAPCSPDFSLRPNVTEHIRTLADVDGDGLVDIASISKVPDPGSSTFGDTILLEVLKGHGNGWFGTAHPNPVDPSGACPDSGKEVRAITTAKNLPPLNAARAALADVNGDGRADFVWLSDTALDVWFQTPLGGLDSFVSFGNHQHIDLRGEIADPTTAILLTGDRVGRGIQDVGVYNGNGLVLLYTYSADFVDPQKAYDTPPPVPNITPRDGLLTSVDNLWTHTRTDIEYQTINHIADVAESNKKTSTPPARLRIPMPWYSVSKVTTTDTTNAPGAGSSSEIEYSYDTPVFDTRDHTFVGFQHSTAHQIGDGPTAPGRITRTTYATDSCPVRPYSGCDPTNDYGWRMWRGRPVVTEVRADDAAQTRISTTVTRYRYAHTYTELGGGRLVRSVYPQVTDTYLFDATAQDTQTDPSSQVFSVVDDGGGFDLSIPVALPKTGGKHLQHLVNQDYFGNIVSTVDVGEVGVDTPIMATFTVDLPPGDRTGWNYRTKRVQVGYSSGTAFAPSREYDYEYDATGSVVKKMAPLTGTLPLDRANPSAAPGPVGASADTPAGAPLLLESIDYDAFGNAIRVQRPNNRCTEVVYDDAFHHLPRLVNIFRGGCGVNPITTAYTYDPGGLEVVTGQLSPNRELSLTSYDAFGRVKEIDAPDEQIVGHTSNRIAAKVDYIDSGLRTIHVVRSDGTVDAPRTVESYTYLDGFGRVIATRQQGDTDASWIVSGALVRNPHGSVARVYEPFATSGDSLTVPAGTRSQTLTYDALGRITKTVGPDGVQTYAATYHPLSRDVQDAEQLAGGGHTGASSTTILDGHGRLKQSVFHLKSPADDTTASYDYLATGEVKSVTRSHTAGKDTVIRWMQYDSLGRLVFNVEPNTMVDMNNAPGGNDAFIKAWRYAYNDDGDLVGTSDARGCGENRFYDNVGRLVAEDYWPCAKTQVAYTPPNLASGDGTEAFYQYDSPEPGQVTGASGYVGRLAASSDRAQHTRYAYDGRGRVSEIERQIANPRNSPAGYTALATRYAPTWFRKTSAFDDASRIVQESTGADAAALVVNGASSVTTRYTPRGFVASATSSYGDLLVSETVNPNGSISSRTYGDAAHTLASFDYYLNGRVHWMHLSRLGGPWAAESATYKHPDPADPEPTLQQALSETEITYDLVGNVRDVADNAEGWPTAAKPVSRTAQYDDTYRVRQVDFTYNGGSGGDDTFVSPYAPDANSSRFPVMATPPNRVRQQTYDYDWMGNLKASGDDANVFGDRSIGTIVSGGNAGAPNQMNTATRGNNTITTSYDEAGNLTQWTVQRCDGTGATAACKRTHYIYYWDEIDRLSLAQRGEEANGTSTMEVNTGFIYDAAGERVVKFEFDAGAPSSTYDVSVFNTLRLEGATWLNGDFERTEQTEVVLLHDGSGATYGRTVVDSALPSPNGSPLHVFFEFGDHLGSMSVVVDKDTSEVVEKATYQTYGATESDYRPARWAHFRDTYRFTGHVDDAEVGLVYFGQRYYAPAIGQWISPDPLTIHEGGADPNPYAYVGGNPLSRVDPLGLDTAGCDSSGNACQQPPVTMGPPPGAVKAVAGALSDAWNAVSHWFPSGHNNPAPPPPPPAERPSGTRDVGQNSSGTVDPNPIDINVYGPHHLFIPTKDPYLNSWNSGPSDSASSFTPSSHSNWDIFMWGAVTDETPALLGLGVRGGVENIGLFGTDSNGRDFSDDITATGIHLGSEEDNVGWFKGVEVDNRGVTTPFTAWEANVGLDIGLGGIGFTGGVFNPLNSDSGFYFGVNLGGLGQHMSFGVGMTPSLNR